MLVLFLLVALLFVILYVFSTWNSDHWLKRGIFGPEPIPLLGNYPKSALLLQNIIYDQAKLYEAHKENHRFIGVFERRTPKILILDTKLVSDVYVKYFKHFQVNDSSNSFDEKLDPIFSRNIFATRYDEWRNKRPEISQAFTQIKLRQMFLAILNSGKKMVRYIDVQTKTQKLQTLDTKELASRFTADIVMHCIYGMDSDAFDMNGSLHTNLVHWFNPSLAKNVANSVLSTFPILTAIYKPSFFPPELTEWFYNTTDVAILHRQRSGSLIQQNDFLQFLLKRKQMKNYTNKDLTNIAAIFFFDAFETSGMMLAQALYHIANNTQCQNKLREEIMTQLTLKDGPNIEDLNAMHYLDCIVNETFRISPSAFLSAKNCTEPVEINDYDGKNFLIERGTSVQLPVYAIHHDERFYDEPNVYKPERFDSVSVIELKKNGLFLPFGDGPRICIGQKFALYQIKLGIVNIIRHYSIKVNNKTVQPIIASPLDSLLTPISDIYLDFHQL